MQALTAKDYETLDTILETGAMQADEADGFLYAIALCPEKIDSSLALTELVRSCEVSDREELLAELLKRRLAQILAELKAGKPFDPILFEDGPEGPEALEGFAFGFYQAALVLPGFIDTEDEDIAGAVLSVLRYVPEEAFLKDEALLVACRELAHENPIVSLDEALDDVSEAIETLAEEKGLKKVEKRRVTR